MPSPTWKGGPLATRLLLSETVPLLNWNRAAALVMRKMSASTNPLLMTFVPRRTSRTALFEALVISSEPPSTTMRLLVEKLVLPKVTLSLAATVAPLETTNWLRGPDTPTTRVVALLHNAPEPVTNA